MRFINEYRRVADWRISQSLVVIVTLAGCGVAQVSPQGDAINAPAPTTGIRSSVPSTTNDSKSDPKNIPGGDASVRLGVGDLIELSVYDVPELNTKTRVSDSGDIYLPLVNYVHVDGLTINDAAIAIEKRLDQGGFIRNPHVQIFIDESTSNTASVLGEVMKPGVYPVMGERTLFSIVSAV
jgi:protein involved in polysaccharide export with SLBB domain